MTNGYSCYRQAEFGENEQFVKEGISLLEAIKAATIVSVLVFNLHKNLGTIEIGKFADLILVDGNLSKTSVTSER